MRKRPTYEKYVEQYKLKEAQLKKKGYTMATKINSRLEYEWNYNNALRTQQNEVQFKKRKRVNNVLRDMINDQAYQVSRKQAIAYIKASELLGDRKAYMEIMTDKSFASDFQALIKEADEKYLKINPEATSKERQEYIAATFFGSE